MQEKRGQAAGRGELTVGDAQIEPAVDLSRLPGREGQRGDQAAQGLTVEGVQTLQDLGGSGVGAQVGRLRRGHEELATGPVLRIVFREAEGTHDPGSVLLEGGPEVLLSLRRGVTVREDGLARQHAVECRGLQPGLGDRSVVADPARVEALGCAIGGHTCGGERSVADVMTVTPVALAARHWAVKLEA